MFNPAITAALQVASNDEESEEFIQTRLKEAKALGASAAISLDLNEKQQKLLDKALSSGTVVKTVDGRFYLNERAVSDRREGNGFMALLILLVAASVIASGAILAARAGG
ncbi:hypothetical protein LZ518_13135 [Sphingomonas sp. RB56-2]|uniref:Uncharacterized protein n=1 Tax=Sphingomonas brevis TaxID=2908206 RepID=A0ABT0SDB3_9SPHN|nr:hypothetical protein [Sphingomonas brevis]MCL6742071.1 hypothetical protein [Sphingomonas brevis]